jgi:hypothetical protein
VNPTPGQRPPAGQARLRELQRGTTIEAALAFYDALEPVGLEEMTGSWRGEDLPTGNPFDGLLERFGWYGKRFDGPDHGHPLVFIARAGRTMSLNPAFVPIAVLIRYPWLVRAPFVPRLFCVLRPLLATGKPKARLRLTAYRGVVTATMCYDALPINDVFRKVDNNTVLGAMDLRGLQPAGRTAAGRALQTHRQASHDHGELHSLGPPQEVSAHHTKDHIRSTLHWISRVTYEPGHPDRPALRSSAVTSLTTSAHGHGSSRQSCAVMSRGE